MPPMPRMCTGSTWMNCDPSQTRRVPGGTRLLLPVPEGVRQGVHVQRVRSRRSPMTAGVGRSAIQIGDNRRVRPPRSGWLFLLPFTVFALLGILWALASPVFSVPDENAHAVKAIAQARGQVIGTRCPGSSTSSSTCPRATGTTTT